MAASYNGKPLSSLKKDELLLFIAEQENRNHECLEKMSLEISSLRDEIVSLRDASSINQGFQVRMIEIERRLSLQEQYSRRECIDIVNVPESVADGKQLEDTVVGIFKAAGVKVSTRNFHAIHRKKGKPTVIAKFVNRRDAIAILRAKKMLDLSARMTKSVCISILLTPFT